MPTTRTRPVADAAFLLSADELHVLEHRTPHIVLPQAFHSEWDAQVSPAEVGEREMRAIVRLRERRILSRSDDVLPQDLTDSIDADFAAFLSMPQFATAAIDASCWTLDRTAIHSVSVIGAHSLGLLRTQRVDHSDAALAEHGTAARDEDVVEIRAFETAGLAQQLLRPVTALHDAVDSRGRSGEVVVLPLADAEALVLALRQDRPDVLGAVVDQLHSPQASTLFGGVAKRLDGGFRLDALSRVADPARRWTDTWLLGADGWVAVSVDTPDVQSADMEVATIAENSRVSLRAVRRADIIAEVLAISASLQGARA